MSDPRYRARVRIEKLEGPHRKARIEPFDRPLEFGVHGAIADFYGATTSRPLPTTLDHVVAAAERALEGHVDGCPVAQTLLPCVEIEWEAEIREA